MHRTVHILPGQPTHRYSCCRRVTASRQWTAPRLRGRPRSPGPRGHGVLLASLRDLPGKRQAGSSPRHRRTGGRRRTGAPHGNVCAAVLATCCEVNVRAMKERDPNNPAIARYTEVAASHRKPRGDGRGRVAWVRETVGLLGVGGLRSLGLTEDQLDQEPKGAMALLSVKGRSSC